ncbi:MAG: endolytic transglycosylase MltG [Parcubacteria group bacterium]|nr:endolytic transglycosylase MltG [Parcubacteria group bacterium]
MFFIRFLLASLLNVPNAFARRFSSRRERRRSAAYGSAVLFLLGYLLFFSAPFGFPAGVMVRVSEGASVSAAAAMLEEKSIINSPFFFKAFVGLFAGETGVKSGDYFFAQPGTLITVAWRLARGVYGLDLVRVLVPEGASAAEIAAIMQKNFPEFEPEEFIRIAQRDEGYLFPDTYFFLPNVKARDVYQALRNNFDLRTKEIESELAASGRKERDIITMASLLEKEVRHYDDKQTVAGILWRRLEIGMPLQVDATFLYINGKNTFELTLDDLQTNESRYNTYKYTGLPPGPIANPGLASIKAALNPRETPYLFYLSDLAGNLHFSQTFEEHKIKKARYVP